jgi:dTDP-4-dehydrorhamnose reductase
LKAWVTGSAGLIGCHLLRQAPLVVPDWTVVGLTRQTLDLEDAPAVQAAWRREPPDLVIHCAALSWAADCQANPDRARRLNVEVTARLAELAADIPFLFFSTDLVFDGRRGHYDETAAVNPLTVYAETKVAAEQVVLANPRHSVVRTSLNFGNSLSGDRSFNEDMRRTCQAAGTLRLFTDEYRCPVAAEVTARWVWLLARRNQPGLFHLAGAERLSRWEIGLLLAEIWPDVGACLRPASLREYQGPPRAPDTSLNCARIEKLLGAPLPRFSEWLARAYPEAVRHQPTFCR